MFSHFFPFLLGNLDQVLKGGGRGERTGSLREKGREREAEGGLVMLVCKA